MNPSYQDFNVRVISIFHKEFWSLHKDCSMFYNSHWEDHYNLDMEPKVMWIQETRCKRMHQDVTYIEPPSEGTKFHLKPLMLQVDIERQMVDKVLVDGWATVNILPRTMFKRFGFSEKDLVKNNIMVTDFNGRSSSSMGW